MGSRTPSLRITLAAAVVALVAAAAAAQSVPSVMSYQGRLTDNSPQQNPVHDTLPMEFRIYGSAGGADLLWSEPWPSVQVNEGIFSVLLGSNGVPLTPSIFQGGTVRYLEIVVDGDVLAPRQQFGKSPWADQAQSAADVVCTGCVGSTDIANSAIGPNQLAANSVNSTHVQNDSLTAADLAPDSVGASEIATNAVGNDELNNSAPFTFTGGVTFEAAAAEFVTRNAGATKLEWWADPTYSYLYHRPAASYLLVNDATGNWGINTTNPTMKFEVNGTVGGTSFRDTQNTSFFVDPAGSSNLQDVTVVGTLYAGYQIVSTNYSLSTSATCHSHGNQTCYYGSACATCPAGKSVIGGGCLGPSARYGNIGYSYPSGTTSWCCSSSYDLANATHTAYAICARLGN